MRTVVRRVLRVRSWGAGSALLSVTTLVTAAQDIRALPQRDDRVFTCERGADDALRPVSFEVAEASAPAPAMFSAAERACWVAWPDAHARVTASQGQWVDVRDAGARRRVAPAGVTAVDALDLPAKAFLKGQSLVLIGSGVDLRPLSARCVALRQSGQFADVQVLLGGVRAWREAGQPVRIDAAIENPDELTPQDFWLGVPDDAWRVAGIGLTREQLARLPVRASFTADADDLPRALEALAARAAEPRSLEVQQRWVVLAVSAAELGQLQALWRGRQEPIAQGSPQPLWLVGAWPAYAAYLQQQMTLAAHAGRPLPRLCGM